MTLFNAQVDVRRYPSKDKKLTIISAWNSLKPGQAMELINDHDPRPLYNLFSDEHTGLFTWDYLEKGPDVWRISISKK